MRTLRTPLSFYPALATTLTVDWKQRHTPICQGEIGTLVPAGSCVRVLQEMNGRLLLMHRSAKGLTGFVWADPGDLTSQGEKYIKPKRPTATRLFVRVE